jgi:ankyrin repeat protein
MATRFFIIALMASSAVAQQSVCELFRDLPANDGRQLILTGELLISKNLMALGAIDCDHRYISDHHLWPTAISLSPSPSIPTEQLKRLKDVAVEADRLRLAGKTVSASGSFAGRLRVAPASDFPAELIFGTFDDLRVETLPDAKRLPVIPICELFQNLPAWRDQRIAVRGETYSTGEASGLSGRCKGAFNTDGYRWPVALNYGAPAYYSQRTAQLSAEPKPGQAKGEETLRGRYSIVRTATYVGRLRMRSEYHAYCRGGGDYLTNGFGHLNFAAAELVVEAVLDEEWTPRTQSSEDEADDPADCPAPDRAARCEQANSLRSAIPNSCFAKLAELLARDGIDSKDGNASPALTQAIVVGNEAVVRLLIGKGAPVNPMHVTLWPPLAEAANRRRVQVMKILLASGANPEAKDHRGVSYLPGYGFFSLGVTKVLLEGGAQVDARDVEGRTALMHAASFGFEDTVKLLIDHRADVNLKDNSGRTPLMHAAGGRYVDAISHLLANHADLYVRDRDGHTALDIARQSKNQRAAEMLSAAMRDKQ